ncbi:hypothetical protein ACIQOU_34010 [Streptomyces sp. NPDC091279]|uniref:hypothetical protein n=1 Tax=Streptomyces sp. NPDC091279 TaxID=3365983 RepID=UPI00382164B3
MSTELSVRARATRLLLGLRRAPDPYAVYERLRVLGPVLPVPALSTVVLCGYDVCRHALRSPDFLVPDTRWRDEHTPGWRRHPSMEQYAASLLNVNPPEHQTLRGRSATLLTRAAVDGLRATVEELAEDCVARLVAAVARHGWADAAEQVALRLPTRAICALLDLPDEDAAELGAAMLRNQVVGELFPSEAELNEADRAVRELKAYFRALGERGHPGAWTRFSPGECGLLLQAGVSTTFALLGTALCALLKDNGALAADLAARPELIPGTVDGWLRDRPPSTMVSRVPRHDVELAGVPVAAHTHLLILIAAANRDPGAPGPLSFGHGPKYCLGAQLARMEAIALVRALLPHAGTWQLTHPTPSFTGYVIPQARTLKVTTRRPPAPRTPPGHDRVGRRTP